MKKVLLITAFFPPRVNVATSRIIKFLKYLPSFGWEVVVVCPFSDKKHSDASRISLEQLSESVQISRSSRNMFLDLVDLRDSSRLARLVSQVMNNVIPPDGHLYWILQSMPHIARVIEDEKPDLVMTTCNPYSLNLIGLWVKRKFNIPWITDFRDLWTMNQHPKRILDFYHQRVSGFLEDYTLKYCDQLVVTTEHSKKRMVEKYPYLENRVVNIPNGFDWDDVQADSNEVLDQRSFFFGGSIVANTMYNPLPLLSLLGDALKQTSNPAGWVVHYAGGDGVTFEELLAKAEAPYGYELHGYLDHSSLYTLIRSTGYVLMCLPPDIDCRSWVPSRFYDYICNKANIICLAKKDSEVFSLLESYGNSLCMYYEESRDQHINKLTNYLSKRKSSAEIPEEFLNRFSRKELTMKLAETFEQATS